MIRLGYHGSFYIHGKSTGLALCVSDAMNFIEIGTIIAGYSAAIFEANLKRIREPVPASFIFCRCDRQPWKQKKWIGTGFSFRLQIGFEDGVRVIVPVHIEFTGLTLWYLMIDTHVQDGRRRSCLFANISKSREGDENVQKVFVTLLNVPGEKSFFAIFRWGKSSEIWWRKLISIAFFAQ